MLKMKWASAAVLLACSVSASAMNLLEAYDAALRNDAAYQAAIADHDSAKELTTVGRAGLMPNVSASYSRFHNRADLTQPNIIGQISTTHPVYLSDSKSVQLRQPLLNLEGWYNYRQAVKQQEYNEAVFDLRGQDLVLRLIGAYSDALFAREQVRLAEVQRAFYEEQMKVNNRMFEKGEGTKTDMLETQARLDVAEATLIESRDNEKTMLATLSAMVGEEVTNLAELSPGFRVLPQDAKNLDAWRETALANNPEIQARRLAVEVAEQDIKKQRAGHAPRVDFIGSYSKSNSDSLNTYQQESTQRAVGIQVNIPLYSGGAVSAQTRQSVAAREKAKADLQAQIDKTLVDLRKQFSIVQSSVTRLAALEKAEASAKLLMTATEQSIKGGVRINLDLLQAQQQLYTTQRDLAQARYNYLLALLRLRSAAGTLSVGDLREVAAYFR